MDYPDSFRGAPRKSVIAELGPLGRWSGSFIPDLRKNASNSPVVVVGTRTLMGNGDIRNLQLTHVRLKNYSAKTVLGVQLKWLVTTSLERSRELAPAQYTGLLEAELPPGETKEIETTLVMFSKSVKTLIRAGSLDGRFVVQVLTYQVEFADGSTWNDDWGGPKPGERGERWRGREDQNGLPSDPEIALQSSCPNTQCSYNSPNSTSFCDADLVPGLVCLRGDPCSPDRVYCECQNVSCAIYTPTPTPTPTATR